MKINRDFCLERIHYSELGFAIRDSEPGGAVNDGVTMATFSKWRLDEHLPAPSINDLKEMKSDEERQIYLSSYFAPVRFDDLPDGVDYVIVDTAVNSGISGALKMSRIALGIPDNPKSWVCEDAIVSGAKSSEPLAVITRLCDERWNRMKAAADFNLPSVVPGKIIGNGRAFRMNVCYGGALHLAGLSLPPEPRYVV